MLPFSSYKHVTPKGLLTLRFIKEEGEKLRAVGLRFDLVAAALRGGNDSGERPGSGVAALWIGFTGKPGGELGDF